MERSVIITKHIKNLLDLNKVDIGYGLSVVLSGVDLHIDRGEIVALLGTNGMGKSTLMRTVAGLMPLLQGTITFDGEVLNGLTTERIVSLGLALVPQGKLLFPTMTVKDNLRLGAYPLRGRSAKQEIEQAFETVFKVFPVLKERSRQRAGTLSGGQQQMLAIGRGLMSRPQLLLLDEPSTGLAPFLVLELMGTLAKLREESDVAILLAEQNAEAALKIAERGYVLGGGRVMIEGSCQELVESDMVKLIYLGKVA
jgi:branched-chain amino acid transport system ATP-binding protein